MSSFLTAPSYNIQPVRNPVAIIAKTMIGNGITVTVSIECNNHTIMSVSNNILNKRPLLTIATPAKTEVHTKYTLSLLSAMGSLHNYFDVTIEILPGKSNIIHARSIMLTNWFDKADNDDLFLFIDSDHVFTADDILRVIKEPNCDVSCGIYLNAANTPNCYPIDRANFERDNRAYFCGTGFMLIRKPICKKIYKWIKTNDKIDRVTITDI